MTSFSFTKMHGLGNDFIIIDDRQNQLHLSSQTIKQLAHRHTGIGFDQLIFLKSSLKADIACQFFNADGSEAKQCGNGLRCVARYVFDKNLSIQPFLKVETPTRTVHIEMKTKNLFSVDMGLVSDLNVQHFNYDNQALSCQALSIGNMHVILTVENLVDFPVQKMGAFIQTLPAFSAGANVGFMQIIKPNEIKLRTYERGVGETYACGTNACAAVVAGIQTGDLTNEVSVEYSLGKLKVQWQGLETPVFLTGDATPVFDGYLEI